MKAALPVSFDSIYPKPLFKEKIDKCNSIGHVHQDKKDPKKFMIIERYESPAGEYENNAVFASTWSDPKPDSAHRPQGQPEICDVRALPRGDQARTAVRVG